MRRRWIPIILGLVVGATACSGESASRSSGSANLLEMLEFIPADDFEFVLWTDLEAMQVQGNVANYDTFDDQVDYFIALGSDFRTGATFSGFDFVAQPPSMSLTKFDVSAWQAAWGFAPADMRAVVNSGRTFVYDVGARAGDIAGAVRSDPVWSGELAEASHDGEPYFDWGDGVNHDLGLTVGRAIPQGGQLAVRGDLAVRTTLDDDMKAALAADGGESIADNADVRPVIDALIDANVVDAIVFRNTVSEVGPALGLGLDELSFEPLSWFDVAGGGVAFDGENYVTTIVYLHDDEAAAAQNRARVEELLATGTSVVRGDLFAASYEIREIRQEGRLVIASLTNLREPGTVFVTYYTRDSLFLTGGDFPN